MQMALQQAQEAESQEEVPIGAVIVDQSGQVIAQAYNRRELDQDSTKHAEIIALQRACQKKKTWRLNDCSLFVTLEPCAMCAGAIINARLQDVYFAALDPKAGACGSVVNLFTVPQFNHHPGLVQGLYREQASEMLKDFFRKIRQKKKREKEADSGKK